MNIKDYLLTKNYLTLPKADSNQRLAYNFWYGLYCHIRPSENSFVFCYDYQTQRIIKQDEFDQYLHHYFDPLLDAFKQMPSTRPLCRIESPCMFIVIDLSDHNAMCITRHEIKYISNTSFCTASLTGMHLYYQDSKSAYSGSGTRFYPLKIHDTIDYIPNVKAGIFNDYPDFRPVYDVLKQYDHFEWYDKMPFTFTEVLTAKKTSNASLMHQHYKKSQNMHIKWNKLKLNECMVFMHLKQKLTNRDFNNLYVDFLNNKHDYYIYLNMDYAPFGTRLTNNYLAWYRIYLMRKIAKYENMPVDYYENDVYDFVNLVRTLRIKPMPCNINSEKRLKTEEQVLIEKMQLVQLNQKLDSKTADVPLFKDKNGKWTKLKNNLKPLNVTILDTKRKLMLEGIKQSNCVGSYDADVKCGDSFIFHYDANDPYTVQVKQMDNKYRIVQIYKKYNQDPDPQVVDYLSNLINR